VRGDDGKPMNQQLLSDIAAPSYLRRAVAVNARQANHQHIQCRTADRSDRVTPGICPCSERN
jgi:hypothetical protein